MDNGVNKPETTEDNEDLLNDLNKSEQQIKDSEGKTFIDWQSTLQPLCWEAAIKKL